MPRSAPVHPIPDNVSQCQSCGSERSTKLSGEICLHFRGLEGLNKPLILVLPQVVVCLDCGSAQFTVPDAEFARIQQNL
jgi:hypothetical protein